jgi:WD40 repeat protein
VTAYELTNSHLYLPPNCTDLDFDLTNPLIARSALEGTVSIVNTESGEIQRSHHCQKYGIHALKFINSSADTVACSGNDNNWRLWDLQANKFIAVFKGNSSIVSRLDCHKKENSVASEDKTGVNLWDTRTPNSNLTATDCSSPSFDRGSGRVLAVSAQKEESVRLYDIRAFHKPFSTFKTQQALTGVKFSDDGALLACTTADRVFLLDSVSGAVCWYSPPLAAPPRQPSFNWKNSLISVSCGNDAVLLDAVGGKIFQILKGHGDQLLTAFSPRKDLLVTSATSMGFWTPKQEDGFEMD